VKKPTLYLIPSTLGDTDIDHILPNHNLDIIKSLRIFIVEELRSARRFLRKAGYKGDFEDIELFVNNEHTSSHDQIDLFKVLDRKVDIGLLSEAGVPCVADPGAAIVKQAHSVGMSVRPLVGPSSILLALMASGFNGQNFVFHGYLPIKKDQREASIRKIEKNIYKENQTQIFIEAPYRNNQLFETIIKVCSPNSRLCIAADLTTANEFIKTRTIKAWKSNHPQIHKRPVVFLLYR